MSNQSKEEVKAFVRERYAKIAKGKNESCCGTKEKSCGDTQKTDTCCTDSESLGYSIEELKNAPEGSDLGLGCGNPQAIANLKSGEVVLDLGSGAGIDCFLAAKRVGPKGHVIGVDMTHEMLAKARENAKKGNFKNTEFRLGEIEHIPVADNSVDVVISNCVINLSPEKLHVYKEAFRVLKSGGRVAVSDVVATAELPEEAKRDLALYTGCVAGAISVNETKKILTSAGFEKINVEPKSASKKFIREWAPGKNVEDYVASANITARKP
jgi:SAM-dependent methyltransferase